jgi:hypothetical protein
VKLPDAEETSHSQLNEISSQKCQLWLRNYERTRNPGLQCKLRMDAKVF